MGLTLGSTGRAAVDRSSDLAEGRMIALVGNPNVGKSTVFNGLTGMNQHTGNWPGKTVAVARGTFRHGGEAYTLVDLPGCYSLLAHSPEEEVARDFICFGGAEAVAVVLDATCLARNLNLALQALEVAEHAVLAVNLLDEAKKKGIRVDLDALSKALGVPVVGLSARSGEGLSELREALARAGERARAPMPVRYGEALEAAIQEVEQALRGLVPLTLSHRWAALRLLAGEPRLLRTLDDWLGFPLLAEKAVEEAVARGRAMLGETSVEDTVVAALYARAEAIAERVVRRERAEYDARQLRIDRILTGKRTGVPIMLALLALVFWLTIAGANVPSALLSKWLFSLEAPLSALLMRLHAPIWLHDALVLGVYRVLAWVVSVMLPPMAIFFPLFTLLEDLGYLPRVAFNLDRPLKRCCACGKQSLTMCMGLGCNAAGVVGCRIIDSPRERLIAILTNNFMPCNGRFPTMLAVLSMFFASSGLFAALLLTGVIVLGVGVTFLASWLLSHSVLKGMPSSFALELPPYRRPQIGRVLVRSALDRTVFVLGRAAAIAAPAGLLIWLMANITIGDSSLLGHCAGFLDPFARLMGLDGVLLMAFLLGFPANEIVLPVALMAYTASGTLVELPDLLALRTLLVEQGWSWLTAACTVLFSLMHWPCSTTLWTIRKETGSTLWAAAAFLLPTIMGMAACMLLAGAARAIGWA